jgi:hypothetical protein
MARTRRRVLVFAAAVAALVLVVAQGVFASSVAAPGAAADHCDPTDQTTKTVARGTTVTYDSAFDCRDAARTGDYEVAVTVANAVDSAGTVRIDGIALGHTTPRPRAQAPDAGAATSDMPVDVQPGSEVSLRVTGDYELVDTDEGAKANLHLRLSGSTVNSGGSAVLGVNVHLRAPGVAD